MRTEDILMYVIIVVVVFTIMVFITRWIFRIDEMVEYQRKQTRLLGKIAKYNNVPENEVRELLGLDKLKYPDEGPLNPIEQKAEI
jgi:hypothetical protein